MNHDVACREIILDGNSVDDEDERVEIFVVEGGGEESTVVKASSSSSSEVFSCLGELRGVIIVLESSVQVGSGVELRKGSSPS